MYCRLRWLLLVFAVALTGCSSVPRVGVYKLEINQGNYVTRDMVDKLRTGMTKSQVRLVLGTPLVIDIFHTDRWDYSYHHELDGQVVENRRFAVYFADDKLAKWEGDETPLPPVYRTTVEGGQSVIERREAAPKEEKGFFRDLWEKMGF
jgi:outer membrane protein assembly factor BamE